MKHLFPLFHLVLMIFGEVLGKKNNTDAEILDPEINFRLGDYIPQENWGQWSPWSDCSKTCGDGAKTRSRKCYDPSCPGESNQQKYCYEMDCPGAPQWSGWSGWSDCTKTCEGGLRTRQRGCYSTVTTRPPSVEQADGCPGQYDQQEECNPWDCPDTCKSGWTFFSNSCYKVFSEKISWEAARQTCVSSLNADLASITSSAERTFAWDLGGRQSTWIGGNDKETEGTWAWSDGTPWDAALWGRGQPNSYRNRNQDCVEMATWIRGLWNDHNCNSKRQFICEKEKLKAKGCGKLPTTREALHFMKESETIKSRTVDSGPRPSCSSQTNTAKVQSRTLQADPIRHWPNGVVPYIISGSTKHPDHCKISKERQYKIKAAMVDIERVANVKFRHATTSDDDYIDIDTDVKSLSGENIRGCYFIGKDGFTGLNRGRHLIHLDMDDWNDNCWKHGMIIHELLHALGFIHEHNHPERNKYIRINWKNIWKYPYAYFRYSDKRLDENTLICDKNNPGPNNSFINFDNCVNGKGYVTSYGTEYDYYSVMHYPIMHDNFKILGDAEPEDVGQYIGLSPGDKKKLRLAYGPAR